MADTFAIRLTEGAVIAGKYRLERALARGGMGSVWVARHIALDEPVAIKLLAVSTEELGDADVRLQREAKSVARLRSPHVVQLLDYGVDRGLQYIVMELLEGETLAARLKRKGRLSLVAGADLLEQVSSALRRAHKAGIIHRDLKPDNIFMARFDDEEIVKLLDFGIVKALRGTLAGGGTQANILLGSPQYMSPEQTFGAKNIDHRTDLWSLAVILFEVVTGRRAFDSDSLVAVLMSIRNGPIPLPSEVAPDLPKEVDAFFKRAFERDPEQRFASARAMATEFSTMVKRLGPRAARTGAPLGDEPPSSNDVELLSVDFIEVETEVTAQPPEGCAVVEGASSPRNEPMSPVAFAVTEFASKPVLIPAPVPVPIPVPVPVPVPAAAPGPPKAPATMQSNAPNLASIVPGKGPTPRRAPATMQSQAPSPQKAPPPPLRPAPPALLEPPAPKTPAPRKGHATMQSKAVEPGPVKPTAVRRSPSTMQSKAADLALPAEGAEPVRTKAADPPTTKAAEPLRAKAAEPSRAKVSEPPTTKAAEPVATKTKVPARTLGSPSPGVPAAGATSPGAAPLASNGGTRAQSFPSLDASELIDQGFAALRAGNRDAAKRCWQAALRVDPSNRAVELNLRKLAAKQP